MLANRLKILLAERDLTIKDLMAATGLSRNSLSNMINNPFANIATDNVDKLCNYLEVSPKDFYDYSGWRFNYELLIDGSSSKEKAENEPLELRLKVSMISGKMRRVFELSYVLKYDMDYGDGGEHDAFVEAYQMDGADKLFIDVYKKISPLFKHQIESELLQPVPVILELANSCGEFDNQKEAMNVQFVYTDFGNNVVFQNDFIYDRSSAEHQKQTDKLMEGFRKYMNSKNDSKKK
ncbi:helix-turn-helix domain-containing protein [Limosilactobacillus reuteri]|uniref:helix-turn-helix domain-containing protein n=1 Tax=Limosilactobacillus reuteri TaxID=1598 RepID=UPI00146DE6C5|nr:helix-turn-helix transcriptional regulator [Limosilactobacillus reuteri]